MTATTRLRVDVVLAGCLFAVMAAELAIRHQTLAVLWAVAITAPILWHRRYPVAAVLVTAVAITGYGLGHLSAFPGYAAFAMVFVVSLHCARGRGLLALGVLTVALGTAIAQQSAPTVTIATWIATVLALIIAWLAGENLRVRQDGRSRPGGRSPRSAGASPGSCTTWSRTR
jgi:hypothetical protein